MPPNVSDDLAERIKSVRASKTNQLATNFMLRYSISLSTNWPIGIGMNGNADWVDAP
jgi:hypothetical protein